MQQDYNTRYGITPETIVKNVSDAFGEFFAKDYVDITGVDSALLLSEEALEAKLADLEKQMYEAAESLDFERAAELRDYIQEIKQTRVSGVV
jgi:excinuclease ABC subunit B